ncbi:S-layer homology domain-containing protein [Paenibacillus sp. UNC451MF]|uniref:S-layer homology domain-containing protein n=1 Tax=Paenibacillus sp. UNC451MF TaxID=1449063 RepID=UPI000490C7E1|nr:S-layer homology domain-containing protein [Paenibacillus sp. UNC451MF]
MFKPFVKPLVAAVLLSQLPFTALPGSTYTAEASSVTDATYGTPKYTRLAPGVFEMTMTLRTVYTTYYYVYGEPGVSAEVTALCTYSIADTNVATVNSRGVVTAVGPGTTVLTIRYNDLTASIPVTVENTPQEQQQQQQGQQTPIVKPVVNDPIVPTSTLDVYSGIDMTRLAAHRQASLDLLNTLRRAVGVPTVSLNENLNKASQAHANYQDIDKKMGHSEEQGRPSFSGVGPWDRAKAFGYASAGSVGETVASTGTAPSGATQVLIDAPFHRVILLMPSFRDLGIGVSNGYTVINPGTKDYVYNAQNYKQVYYPYNGQTGVPPFWHAYETPNPLQYYGKNGAKVGYPISISTTSGGKLDHISAQITDASGNQVDYYLVDSKHSGNEDAILYIPKEPLKPNTTYTVTARFQAGNRYESSSSEENKTWSFTTLADSIESLVPPGYYSTSVEVGGTIKVPAFSANYISGTKTDVSSSVQFTSDSENVSISNGAILGIKAGSAKITASFEGTTFSYTVYVKEKSGVSADGIVNISPPGPKTAAFGDIGSHWAKASIEWAQQYHIVDGYSDGNFHPDGKVTEAEFLAMLFRMYPNSTKDLNVPTGGDWSDTFYSYANHFQLGLTGDARDQAIQRVQVAQVIAGLSGKHYVEDRDAIRYLLSSGYSEGKTAATVEGYGGNDPLTRAEALQFLRNLQEKGFNQLQKKPETATSY